MGKLSCKIDVHRRCGGDSVSLEGWDGAAVLWTMPEEEAV